MLREAASIFAIIILLLPVYLMSFNLSHLRQKLLPNEVICERGVKSIAFKFIQSAKKQDYN